MPSTLWKPEAVRVTRGADNIVSYNKTPSSYRKWCKTCGGHLFTEHPAWGLTDVYAAVIPDFPYQAALHVNYQETTLRIHDGLPKQKDVPQEMGGSGSCWRSDPHGAGGSCRRRRKKFLTPYPLVGIVRTNQWVWHEHQRVPARFQAQVARRRDARHSRQGLRGGARGRHL